MKNEDKKNTKKALEHSITEKFMDAISGLGHDATKLKREIKKAGKFVAKKIDRKVKAVKDEAHMPDMAPIKNAVKKAEKVAGLAKKDLSKKAEQVEKVITKATKTAVKVIKSPVEKLAELTSTTPEEAPATAKKPGRKPAAAKADHMDSADAEQETAAAPKTKKKKQPTE